MYLSSEKALLLFSGGQDSAICLFYALEKFKKIEFIGFDYGQRHHIELEVRKNFLEEFRKEFPEYNHKLGSDKIYDLKVLSDIGETSLTQETEIKILETGLPNTFVPGRNLAFLTIAASHGWRMDISHLIGGMCQTDYSGYPDCRDNSLRAMQIALTMGLDKDISLHTPLMWLSKAQSWKLLEDIAGKKSVKFVIEHTHSCYKGERSHRYEWGYGCNDCPACELRKKGYEEYLLM